jgi:arsenate reductase
MAEAYGKKYLSDKFDIFSAGIEKHGLNKNMLKVLKEDDIDTDYLYSKTVDELGDKNFDFVITLCGHANETCPMYLKKTNLIHRGFEDPAQATGNDEEILETFRKVRNEIKEFVSALEFNLSLRPQSTQRK